MSTRTSHVRTATHQYLSLLLEFYRREMSAKYRGSALGFAWMFLTPLLMFAAYAIAFSGVIGVQRMSPEFSNPMDYLINLYLGLAAFYLISDVMSSSLGSISSRSSYVKKVVFPLSILVVTRVLVAMTAYVVNVATVIVFLVFVGRLPNWSILLTPLFLMIVTIQMLGIAAALSSLGVFLRDIEQIVGPLSRMLLFVTPIAYSLNMVAEKYRDIFLLNPLTSIVVASRDLIIQGTLPEAAFVVGLLVPSILFPILGYVIFTRLRPGFADVV
jgi:lipopolysaccharide transport system permease protein